ncbi:MAG: tetratricopeptide repeat protein [Planctomycetia bacterium]
MKTVNLKLLIIVAVLVIGGMGGVYAIHEYQVYRNADNILVLARERAEEGRSDEAAGLYVRYIGLRNNDNEARAEFAKLMLRKVGATRSSRASQAEAYDALETAVQRNPDDDDLREQLAGFLYRTGNFTEARQHFGLIRDHRVAKPVPATTAPAAPESTSEPGDESAPKAVTPDHLIDLRYATSCAGMGRYDEAAEVASKLIGFDVGTKSFDTSWEPLAECSEAYLLIAEILERRYNDTATASRVMRRLPEVYPTDHKSWLSMATWSFFHNDLSAAGIEIARAAQLAPESPQVLFAEFEIAMRTNDFPRAKKVIEEGLAPYADDARVIIGHADLAKRMADPNLALEILAKGVETLPDNPVILGRLIDLLFDLERGEEAIPHVEAMRAIEGDDNPVVGWADARLLMERRQWHPALEKLKQLRPSVASSPQLAHAVDLAMAICHQALGQSDELLEASRRVLATEPNSYQARVALATAHAQAGRSDEALAEFESLAALQSEEDLPRMQLLWAPLLDLRVKDQLRRPEAERNWKKVDALVELLSTSPHIGNAQLASIQSNVLQRRGDNSAAVEVAFQAFEAAPDDPQVAAQLVTLLLADAQVDRARETIVRITPLVRQDPRVLAAEARSAASLGGEEGEAGLAAVEAACKEIPAKDAVLVLLAVMSIRIQQRNIPEAERIAAVILEREPSEVRAHASLLQIAIDQRDVEKLTAYAEQIGDLTGRSSPQSRVAQAMVLILKVQVARELQLGEDKVSPPISAEDRIDLDQARNYLMEAENDRPGWFQIQQCFAEIAGIRGDTSASISHLQKAIEQGATNPAVPRMLAGLLRQTGRLDEAQQVIDSMGQGAGLGATRIRADIDVQAGRFDEAVAKAEAITLEGSDVDHLLWFAGLLQRCEKQSRALEVLEQAAELAPNRLDCWIETIQQQLLLGKTQRAEETLQRATASLGGAEGEILNAITYEMRRDPAKAEDAYRSATLTAPTDPRVARRFAEFLLRRGQLKPAKEELLRIIAMPEAAGTTSLYWARRKITQEFTRNSTYRELLETLQILEQNTDAEGKMTPEDLKIEFAILMEREEPECWRRAISLLDDLKRRRDLDTEQRVLRAWLQDKLGNWLDSRESLFDIAAEPDCPPAVIATLVEQLIAHGELASARTWANRLRQNAPDAVMTVRLDAKLAIAADDREAAAEAARKLIPSGSLTPENANIMGFVAELVEELRFPKAADKLYKEYADVSAEGILARASFLGRQQRTDEAVELLESAWDNVPVLDILGTSLGILEANGTSPSAAADQRVIEMFAKARRLDPDSAMIQILHGALMELIGKPEESIATYRQLLAKPDLPPFIAARASNNLAAVLIGRKETEEARTLIQSAVVELGPHPTILDTQALVWLARGDTTRAIGDLKEAILAPTATTYLHMAVAAYDARMTSECRAALINAESKGLRKERLNADDRERLAALDKALAEQIDR